LGRNNYAREPFVFANVVREADMKKMIGKMLFGLAVMLATVVAASAQSSGTEPQDKGNTGWTGGQRDQPSQEGQNKGSETTGQKSSDPITQAIQNAHDADSAKTQPVEATGEELKGPSRQFPAAKTPE
jgi:hypothetical protein